MGRASFLRLRPRAAWLCLFSGGEHDEDLDNGKVGETPARLNPAAVRYTDIYRPLLLINESTSSERPGIFNELVSEEKPQLSVEGEFLNRKDQRGEKSSDISSEAKFTVHSSK